MISWSITSKAMRSINSFHQFSHYLMLIIWITKWNFRYWTVSHQKDRRQISISIYFYVYGQRAVNITLWRLANKYTFAFVIKREDCKAAPSTYIWNLVELNSTQELLISKVSSYLLAWRPRVLWFYPSVFELRPILGESGF